MSPDRITRQLIEVSSFEGIGVLDDGVERNA